MNVHDLLKQTQNTMFCSGHTVEVKGKQKTAQYCFFNHHTSMLPISNLGTHYLYLWTSYLSLRFQPSHIIQKTLFDLWMIIFIFFWKGGGSSRVSQTLPKHYSMLWTNKFSILFTSNSFFQHTLFDLINELSFFVFLIIPNPSKKMFDPSMCQITDGGGP